MRAWLITHHAPLRLCTGYDSIRDDDLVIAVDGGLQRCLELKLQPQVLIGDQDSVDAKTMDNLPESCHTISFTAAKDETDTQLAMEYCLRHKIREIIICNDLAGRFDHCLGLVQNLLQARKAGLKATIISEHQLVFLLEEENSLDFQTGTLISLIPLSDEVHFQSSSGLSWSLFDVILHNWQSRGISNVLTSDKAEISIKSGLALAVVTPKQGEWIK